MNIHFTTNPSFFIEKQIPKCGMDFFVNNSFPTYNYLYYPKSIVCNRTYYKYYDDINKIVAIRILAFSMNDNGVLCCLVQEPNEQPRWIANFITPKSIVFEHRNDFFEFANGNTKLNIVGNVGDWQHIMQPLVNYGYNQNKHLFSGSRLYASYIWDNKDCQVKNIYSKVKYIFFTNDVMYICLSHQEGSYSTKEECLAKRFNDLIIEDFADEPINIKLTLLPNTPKVSVIKILEIEKS